LQITGKAITGSLNMPKKERTIKCKTCDYIRSHPENSVNADLLKGVPYSAISYKTGLGIFTLKKHFEEQHMMARFLPRSRAMKVGREQDSLLTKVNEIYEDCKDNAGKAKNAAATSRDYRDASGCWDAATRALSILKPEEKQQVNQTTTVNNYDNLSKEELRELVKLTAKIEGSEEGVSEEKPD
jgi:hypothetical protein